MSKIKYLYWGIVATAIVPVFHWTGADISGLDVWQNLFLVHLFATRAKTCERPKLW